MKKSQHRHRDRRRTKAASPYKDVRWNKDRTVKSMQVKPGRVVRYTWKAPKESPWAEVWNSGHHPPPMERPSYPVMVYEGLPPGPSGTIHEARTISAEDLDRVLYPGSQDIEPPVKAKVSQQPPFPPEIDGEPFREFTDAGLKEKSDGTDTTT